MFLNCTIVITRLGLKRQTIKVVVVVVVSGEWRTQEFFSGWGVQQIQSRTEGR
jgi:hypothetical protein